MTDNMIDMTQLSEREEVEMLVPFYVTGRISQDDAARVEAYLRRNPDFAEHIELARDERMATVSVNEALGFPSARATDSLFDDIASQPPPIAAAARAKTRGLMAAVRGLFTAPTPQAVRYAAIAAAAVVMIQAGILTAMMSGPQSGAGESGYQTASGSQGNVLKAAALIAFQDGATLSEMTRALNRNGARIIEGPTAEGYYRLSFSQANLGDADMKAKLAALRAETEVIKLVLPAR